MVTVAIELDFDSAPTEAEVYNYLNELMSNDMLDFFVKETTDDNYSYTHGSGSFIIEKEISNDRT